jgi:hypothetical protein
MNTEALFLFLILLLGLVLCSFLGGNCGKEGFDSNKTLELKTGTIFTDPSGNTITVIDSKSLKLVQKNAKMSTILTSTPPASITATANTFYSQTPVTFTARVVKGSDGKTAINIKLPDMKTIVFTQSSSSNNNSSSFFGSYFDNYNHYSGSGSSAQLQNGMVFTDTRGNHITVITNSNGTQNLQMLSVGQHTPMVLSSTPPPSYKGTVTANTFYAPVGGITATVITDNNNQTAIKVTIQGNTVIFKQSGSSAQEDNSYLTSTQYYGSTGYPLQQSGYSLAYQGPYGGSASSTTGYYGGSAGSVTGPQGNTASYAQGPQGNTVAGTSSGGYGDQYYSTLPQGISKSQIPAGQEDLYILKSQVVPPVCPACPSFSGGSGGSGSSGGSVGTRQEKCPPCPACARCPEPSFECKKVPNYNAIGSDSLPTPVLSDFSSFGM